MQSIEIISGPRQPPRPRQRRHRPDHPQAVPQAYRAHRLRRVPLLRLGQGARLGPAGQPDPRRRANFGCGSSREHAPWALEDYGFRAIVAPSLRRHLLLQRTKIGLLPIVLDEDHCQGLAAAREGQVDLRAQEVRYPGVDGAMVTASFEIDQEIRRRLLDGLDDIGVTLHSDAQIASYEHDRERSGPVTTAL